MGRMSDAGKEEKSRHEDEQEQGSGSKMGTIITILIVILVLGLAGFGGYWYYENKVKNQQKGSTDLKETKQTELLSFPTAFKQDLSASLSDKNDKKKKSSKKEEKEEKDGENVKPSVNELMDQ